MAEQQTWEGYYGVCGEGRRKCDSPLDSSIGLASVLRSSVTDLPLTVGTSLDLNQRSNYQRHLARFLCRNTETKFMTSNWAAGHYTAVVLVVLHFLNMGLNAGTMNMVQ